MTILSEFFWSRQSAEAAGQRVKTRHGYDYSVSYALRADGSRDWLLKVFG